MNTHKSIYGYLNATLHSAHSADPKEVCTETSIYSDPLGCFDTNPEEILYKAHWDAYFNDRP